MFHLLVLSSHSSRFANSAGQRSTGLYLTTISKVAEKGKKLGENILLD